MVLVLKMALIFLIYVYNGRKVSILVKRIEINIDMPDVIQFSDEIISCRQETNWQGYYSVGIVFEGGMWLITDKLIR